MTNNKFIVFINLMYLIKAFTVVKFNPIHESLPYCRGGFVCPRDPRAYFARGLLLPGRVSHGKLVPGWGTQGPWVGKEPELVREIERYNRTKNIITDSTALLPIVTWIQSSLYLTEKLWLIASTVGYVLTSSNPVKNVWFNLFSTQSTHWTSFKLTT